jgi:hypothetical protein
MGSTSHATQIHSVLPTKIAQAITLINNFISILKTGKSRKWLENRKQGRKRDRETQRTLADKTVFENLEKTINY